MDIPCVEQGEGIGNPFDLVMCPYNPAHLIQRYKLELHLVKCRAQHKHSHTKVCPFNTKHIIPEEKFDHHVRTCPDRTMLDHVKYNIDSSCDQPAPEAAPLPEVHASEDWENDNFQAYDPQEQTSRQPHIIRRIRGAPPSERRAFRAEQRRNFKTDN